MENQKQEVKQEVKQVVKLCPFISGFVMELSKISLKENGLIKTTNVAPCLKSKCMFYDSNENVCGLVLGIESLVTLKNIMLEEYNEEQQEQQEQEQEQGEGTDNE